MHRLTVSAAAMNPKERCAKQHYVTAVAGSAPGRLMVDPMR